MDALAEAISRMPKCGADTFNVRVEGSGRTIDFRIDTALLRLVGLEAIVDGHHHFARLTEGTKRAEYKDKGEVISWVMVLEYLIGVALGKMEPCGGAERWGTDLADALATLNAWGFAPLAHTCTLHKSSHWKTALHILSHRDMPPAMEVAIDAATWEFVEFGKLPSSTDHSSKDFEALMRHLAINNDREAFPSTNSVLRVLGGKEERCLTYESLKILILLLCRDTAGGDLDDSDKDDAAFAFVRKVCRGLLQTDMPEENLLAGARHLSQCKNLVLQDAHRCKREHELPDVPEVVRSAILRGEWSSHWGGGGAYSILTAATSPDAWAAPPIP